MFHNGAPGATLRIATRAREAETERVRDRESERQRERDGEREREREGYRKIEREKSTTVYKLMTHRQVKPFRSTVSTVLYNPTVTL